MTDEEISCTLDYTPTTIKRTFILTNLGGPVEDNIPTKIRVLFTDICDEKDLKEIKKIWNYEWNQLPESARGGDIRQLESRPSESFMIIDNNIYQELREIRNIHGIKKMSEISGRSFRNMYKITHPTIIGKTVDSETIQRLQEIEV